ncbi:hypothetical protein CRYUN_Cryun38cG0082000 [Craigia yunnanensis]
MLLARFFCDNRTRSSGFSKVYEPTPATSRISLAPLTSLPMILSVKNSPPLDSSLNNASSINLKGQKGNPGISMAPLLPPSSCRSKLITRSDDTEVVKERLRIYNEKGCEQSMGSSR